MVVLELNRSLLESPVAVPRHFQGDQPGGEPEGHRSRFARDGREASDHQGALIEPYRAALGGFSWSV